MKKYFTKFQVLSTLIFFLFTLNGLSAQEAHISTQAHENKVTALLSLENALGMQEYFYSAGQDGFVIKWNENGNGEHYQLSDMQISALAKNPKNNDVAIFETDSSSINRVTVLDWKTFRKKYTKRFTDTVTSLSYSANGTYLIIGTAAVNGTYILNATTGSVVKKLDDVPGVISLIKTSKSEKSAVFYSSTGSLLYYNLENFSRNRKFSTEASLEQTILFGAGKFENRFFAGTKDNTIFIIDSTSGKTVAQYQAQNPLICASLISESDGLYFVASNGKNFTLNHIYSETLAKRLKNPSYSLSDSSDIHLVKNFTGLPRSERFTCAGKLTGKIILGTTSGSLYSMTDIVESETLSLEPLTEKMYEKIFDITSDSKKFYLLTKDSLFASSYDTKSVERISDNAGHTNMIHNDGTFILWSKNSRKTVQLISKNAAGDFYVKNLFTPEKELQTVRFFGGQLVFVQGRTSVSLYNMETSQTKELYSGTSIEDAVLLNNSTIIVAKTSSSASDFPLISVNVQTGETAPISVEGFVAYSLSYDESSTNVYGILIRSVSGTTSTEVFSYNSKTGAIKTIMKLNDEDSSAFTAIHLPSVYSNLGKNQINSYNTRTNKTSVYRRSASMPLKLASTGSRIAVLNRDGGISWYNPSSQTAIADWYLSVTNNWYEF